jgi:hypothetical protein
MTSPTTTAKKTLIISIPGAEGQKELPIDIVPGTKPRDVLQRLSLTGFGLSRPGGGGMIGINEDLFPIVEDGQKLHATPTNVEAGVQPATSEPPVVPVDPTAKAALPKTPVARGRPHEDRYDFPLILLNFDLGNTARRSVVFKASGR